MKSRDTWLGFLVLALVVGGVWWARIGHSPSPRTEAPSSSTTAGRATTMDDATVPDVTLADAIAAADGVDLTLSVSPRPPAAFAKKRFRVRATRQGAAQALDGGRISFEMVMPMGDHRYTLVPSSGGWYEAEVVLPFCQSGNPRWYATVDGSVAGRPVTARFRLDLTRRTTP